MSDITTNSAVLAAATRAGMIDGGDLRILDTRGVTIGADGVPQFPDRFFDAARAAKPHLFRKDVRKLSAPEYAAMKDEYLRTARGRR